LKQQHNLRWIKPRQAPLVHVERPFNPGEPTMTPIPRLRPFRGPAPNWTGRLPIQGMPLLLLVATWLAGRVAVTLSASIGWIPAAAIDGAFLLLLAGAATREIVAGSNWRNLRIVAMICVLAAANLAFHLEACRA
jgi:NnrS protein